MAHEDELAVEEGIGGGIIGLDGRAAVLVEEGEEEVEAPQELDEPLVDEGLGHEDENAVGAAGEVQAVEDETGLDGLAEADLVGEEDAGGEAAGGLGGDGHLVRNEVDAGAGVSAGRRLADARVVREGLEPELVAAVVVGVAGEEAVLGLDEAQRVEELLLGNLGIAAVVDDQAVAFLGRVDRELRGVLVLDAVAGFEAGPQQRRGGERVHAHLLGGGETDLNAVAFGGNDKAESEFGFGTADPSLSRKRLLHGRDAEGRDGWCEAGTGKSFGLIVPCPLQGRRGAAGLCSMSSSRTRKAHLSAASRMRLLVGLPAPWPALVSMRMRTGLSPVWACWRAAANLKLWAGHDPVVVVGGE